MGGAASSDTDGEIGGINVTPSVDIALVLLIIFMVTAKYIVAQSIPVDLPNARSANDTEVSQMANVSVDRAGALFLDARPVTEAALRAQLAQRWQGNPELRAVISADRAVPHGRVSHRGHRPRAPRGRHALRHPDADAHAARAMSETSARDRAAAASAVFDETPKRSGLITLAIHAALFAALAVMACHPRARRAAPAPAAAAAAGAARRRGAAAAATPATPRAPASAHRRARPVAAAHAAPPPVLTATGNTAPAGDAVPTGTNTNYRGGDTASTGRGNEGGHGERATPEAPPAPAVPSGPVDLPDEATAPEAEDGNAQPDYPESLREAGVQGTVIARFVVRADGSVGEVRVVRGPEELHDAVREALRRWRFRPATLNGHAIAVYRTMPFRFVLDNL
ncbi:MAG: TonB family protein [Polyangiales bacterium]